MSTHAAIPPSALRIGIVLRKEQLRWRAVQNLIDGLTGSLTLSQVVVMQDSVQDPAWLSALVAIENSLFSHSLPRPITHPMTRDTLDMCDVIIDFRTGAAAESLAAKTRFGVWQIACADDAAVIAGASAIEGALLLHSPHRSDAMEIGTMRIQTKTLVSLSRLFACEKLVQLVLHLLRRLSYTGMLPTAPQVQAPNVARVRSRARAWELLPYAVNVLRAGIERLRDRRGNRKPFALRLGRGTLPDIDPASGTDITPVRGTYMADPFLLETNGTLLCFYEEYVYATGIGRIAVARVTETGLERIGTALEAPYHLSFPHVFELEGTQYMIPETIAAGRIEIWRATDFPLGWTRHATGPDGFALGDPVLFFRDGEWWLFGNSCHDSFGDFSSELCIFRVDAPDLKTIIPHPLNPVVVGSDVARNAGRVFERNGRLYRMSQDNSGPHYGYGLNIMEITDLTANAYSERRLVHFTPDMIPGAIGCHHADSAAGRYVIDLRWP